MRSHLPALLTVVGSFPAALLAQTVTVPAALALVEGGGSSNVPFGSSQACRYQCIYDAEELPWVGPRVITGLLLRADNNLPNTTIPQKGYLDISVLMSTTSKSSITASATFDENRGTDATWVIQHASLLLPAQPALPAGPRPANIPFVFNVPWAYGLTPAIGALPAPRNLLVEIHIHSQPNGAYRLDNLSSCTAQQASFGTVGPACAVPGGQPVELVGDVSMLAGAPYTWHVTNAPASMPFLLMVNATNVGGLFGNPAWQLPYPMFDPANPSQPSAALAPLLWPAPDCWLNVDPIVGLGGVADTSGIGLVTGQVPPGRQMVGQSFFAQVLVLAPTANPLRFITSLGRQTTICGPLGVARIHAFYNGTVTPPPTPPTTGAVQAGVGLVFDVM